MTRRVQEPNTPGITDGNTGHRSTTRREDDDLGAGQDGGGGNTGSEIPGNGKGICGDWESLPGKGRGDSAPGCPASGRSTSRSPGRPRSSFWTGSGVGFTEGEPSSPGGMITFGGLPSGAPGSAGSGTADEVPSTGIGLQLSLAGSSPRSSWVPEVTVAHSDRKSRAEVLTTTRSRSPSVLSSRALANSRCLSALGWSPKVNPSSADSALRLKVYKASPGSASRDSRTLIPDSDISRHNAAAAATTRRPRVSSGSRWRFRDALCGADREVQREPESGSTGLVPSCTTEENSAMIR